ncbi:MAG: branched-chain amino acid ABC transporter permease, partial [Rubrivivax sp.]
MDLTIAGILALDGLTNGAVYALLALATVLVFAVTRVIFIPQGEFVAFGALTLALLQAGRVPGTVWFLLMLAGAVTLAELVHGLRHRHPPARLARSALRTLAWPVAVSLMAIWAAPRQWPLLAQAALTVALVTPFGPLIY